MFMSVHNTINVSKVIYKCRTPILLLPVSILSSIFTLSSTIVVLFHCFRRFKADNVRSHGTDPIGMVSRIWAISRMFEQ